MAEPRMSIAWPVTLGTDDRSTMVMEISRRVLASQYARQGPAMPAPDMRTFNLDAAMVLRRLVGIHWGSLEYIPVRRAGLWIEV